MSGKPNGIYMCTLPWEGPGNPPLDYDPNTEYSLLLDNDTEDGSQQFHTPDDWNVYQPLTARRVVSEAEVAGASSGPSLGADLPPGIPKLPPNKPR